jgi:hypothetical protein
MRIKQPVALSKRRLWITAGGLLVLLLIYGGLSLWTWQSYNQRLESRTAAYKKLTDTIFSGSAEPKTRAEAVAALSKALKKDEAGRCAMAWPFAWQGGLLPAAAASRDHCEKAASRFVRTRQAASALAEYLAVETKVTTILTGVSGQTVSEKELVSKGLQPAKTAVSKLNALTPAGKYASKLVS